MRGDGLSERFDSSKMGSERSATTGFLLGGFISLNQKRYV